MNELSAMANPIAGPWGRPVDGAAACGLEPAPWVSADWSSSINPGLARIISKPSIAAFQWNGFFREKVTALQTPLPCAQMPLSL